MTVAKALKRGVVQKPFVRSLYNYDRRAATALSAVDANVQIDLATGKIDVCPSKTIQSEKENCDINVIVRRFGVTGHMPPLTKIPQYADFEDVVDFHTAMNAVRQAEESFMQLPADLRSKLGNDPQNFLRYCADPKNIDEMRALGIALPDKDVIVAVKAADSPQSKQKESGNVDNASGVDSGKSSAGKAAKGGEGNG